MIDLITKIKRIEDLVCENHEELELEYIIEENLYEDYLDLEGASDEQLEAFEKQFSLTLPEDIKELYRYKNGSDLFCLLFPNDKLEREFKFRLLSLEEMAKEKESFQNRRIMMSEVYSYGEDEHTDKLLERMKDSRVRPCLSNKKWFPFAQADGDIYLMLDYDPAEEGVEGQIICYIHDPDEIAYVATSVTEIIDDSILNITFEDEETS